MQSSSAGYDLQPANSENVVSPVTRDAPQPWDFTSSLRDQRKSTQIKHPDPVHLSRRVVFLRDTWTKPYTALGPKRAFRIYTHWPVAAVELEFRSDSERLLTTDLRPSLLLMLNDFDQDSDFTLVLVPPSQAHPPLVLSFSERPLLVALPPGVLQLGIVGKCGCDLILRWCLWGLLLLIVLLFCP
ncbi:hypothetical protein Q8A67_012746 [Cirrhinus molitorella]|uniref:Uncharacterized protein n=1 Tax=Cirrhinus molitorella TaxID=172907 RepID=A0AA88TPC9_9TELE|nr:hypothetical protein Q8A67_012746 [Cirrhinus molitorella]